MSHKNIRLKRAMREQSEDREMENDPKTPS